MEGRGMGRGTRGIQDGHDRDFQKCHVGIYGGVARKGTPRIHTVVGRGSAAINDHSVEQWSRLSPNTRNLGRDSRISPRVHGSLSGPWSPIFRWCGVGLMA